MVTDKPYQDNLLASLAATYSLIVSLQLVRTTQSMGRIADRKWDFWTVLLRIGAWRGPGFVTSIIRRRFMTL